MSQAFTPSGRRVPVTVVRSGPNVVTQVKKEDRDGYWALQLGFGQRKIKNITKPLKGHLRGAIKDKKIAPRYLREVRLEDVPEYKVGDTIKPQDVLAPGDVVQATGISKGKGFAGVVKRWGFAGGPRTHGQSDRLRAPGSIGQTTTPGRVFKGKKMAGRMGGVQKTVKNLTVLKVDEETGEIWLSGPVPGSPGSLLLIKQIGEKKNFEDLYGEEQKEAEKTQEEKKTEEKVQSKDEEPEEVIKEKDGSEEDK